MWHYTKRRGPISFAELQRLVANNELNEDDLVWHEEKTGDWKRIGDIAELVSPSDPRGAPGQTPKLVVCPPPSNARMVFSENPDADAVREAVEKQAWEDITFVMIEWDENNLFECSGSIPDGFSASVFKAGKQQLLEQAPESKEEMVKLLQSYLADDAYWKSLRYS